VDSNLTVSLLPMPNNFVVHAFELAELQVSAEQRRKRHESVSEPAQFNPSKNVNCSLHHLHHFFLPLALA